MHILTMNLLIIYEKYLNQPVKSVLFIQAIFLKIFDGFKLLCYLKLFFFS